MFPLFDNFDSLLFKSEKKESRNNLQRKLGSGVFPRCYWYLETIQRGNLHTHTHTQQNLSGLCVSTGCPNTSVCHLVCSDGCFWCLPQCLSLLYLFFRHLQNLSTMLGTKDAKMVKYTLYSQKVSNRPWKKIIAWWCSKIKLSHAKVNLTTRCNGSVGKGSIKLAGARQWRVHTEDTNYTRE